MHHLSPALIAWAGYVVVFFAIWPVGFRFRYSRYPYVKTRRVTRYVAMDWALGIVLAAGVVWVAFAREFSGPRGWTEWGGLALVACGACLRVWTLGALGPGFYSTPAIRANDPSCRVKSL